MEKIKFAILGCGRIAQKHAALCAQFGELVAVCDIDSGKAETLACQYGAIAFDAMDKFLENIPGTDIVVICTPNGLHASHAISAMQSGYHVLVEKPMALKTEDAKQMIETSAATGRHLFTVMQNRFNPPVAALKKALDENWFGKIFSIQLTCLWHRPASYYTRSWHGMKEMDGGTLFTQFSHFIDLLYWLFGGVKKISGYVSNAGHQGLIDFEDNGVVALIFDNGALGTIHFSVNSQEKNREGSLVVLGESGELKIGGAYLNTIEFQQFRNGKELLIPANEKGANEYGTYQGSMSNHDKVYENMIRTFITGDAFYATALQGFKTVELIERIYAAALLEN